MSRSKLKPRGSPQSNRTHHKSLKLQRPSALASVSPQPAHFAAKSLIFHRPGQAPDTPLYYVKGGRPEDTPTPKEVLQ
jgi:hypothetical protein